MPEETIHYQRLEELRAEKGWSRRELDYKVREIHPKGFPPESQKGWATTPDPGMGRAVAVAKVFEVSLDYLMGRTDVRRLAHGHASAAR